ncbi:hypothetical protein [Pedobacter chinensis]|uniref:hypothetical protein n=1 Tax=Pedobacter chinensis TaxID=2282421 RepID=UPI0011C07BCD|nr:hypothetical protein [Pedobacter chinensis]
MRKLSSSTALLFLLLIFKNTRAETGCAISSTPGIATIVYTTESPVGSGRYNSLATSISGALITPPLSQCGNYYKEFVSVGPFNSCRHGALPPYNALGGYLVNYITYCPIPLDDYIPLLFLTTGSLGFFIVRNRKISLVQSDQ